MSSSNLPEKDLENPDVAVGNLSISPAPDVQNDKKLDELKERIRIENLIQLLEDNIDNRDNRDEEVTCNKCLLFTHILLILAYVAATIIGIFMIIPVWVDRHIPAGITLIVTSNAYYLTAEYKESNNKLLKGFIRFLLLSSIFGGIIMTFPIANYEERIGGIFIALLSAYELIKF